jgi:putative hydrolase of HD superfamily
MNALEFADIAGKLKRVKRTGWVRREVPDPESVADHSYRLAVLALALAPLSGVDENKVIKMALIHDLAEAIIGDIVTFKGGEALTNRDSKLKKERQEMKEILDLIDLDTTIFDEFVANSTTEAKFVNDLDRLEMAITGVEYAREHDIDVTEILATAEALIQTEQVRSLLQELVSSSE